MSGDDTTGTDVNIHVTLHGNVNNASVTIDQRGDDGDQIAAIDVDGAEVVIGTFFVCDECGWRDHKSTAPKCAYVFLAYPDCDANLRTVKSN